MDNQDEHLAGLGAAFLGGALVGAIAALLLAPASGQATRARLKDYADKTEQEVRERLKGIQEAIARCHEVCHGHQHKATDGPRAPVT